MSERQSPYGPPLNHRFTLVRDAVQPSWFTAETLSGETFRFYSPELARILDDREERRMGIPEYEGDGDFPDLEEILTERRLNRPRVMEEGNGTERDRFETDRPD